MAHFKSLAMKTGKAIYDFKMIEEGDKILICYSGGKDSYTLVKILEYLKRRYPIDFELKILTIDPGFDPEYSDKIRESLNDIEIPFEIVNNKANEIIEVKSREKKMNPCFMCSRLRRGVIYNYARENGFNKVALGHNIFDAIETSMLNTFYSNRQNHMKPILVDDKESLTVIRPMIYLDEEDIIDVVTNVFEFEPIEEVCPLKQTNKSKREVFRKFILELRAENPKIIESYYHSMFNVDYDTFWDRIRGNPQDLDNFEELDKNQSKLVTRIKSDIKKDEKKEMKKDIRK